MKKWNTGIVVGMDMKTISIEPKDRIELLRYVNMLRELNCNTSERYLSTMNMFVSWSLSCTSYHSY